MSPCVQGSVLWVCLLMAAAGPAQAATEPNDQTNDPHFALEQIQKRLDAIANYQCTLIPRSVRGRAPNLKSLAYNSHGHSRVKEADSNWDTTSTICDGTRTIRLHERVKPNGTVVYSATVLPDRYDPAWRGDLAWNYLGGFLAGVLKNALQKGAEIGIAPTEDGDCYLEIRPGSSPEVIATVLDPQRGYLPVRQDVIIRGERIRATKTEFSEVKPGVWFPTAVWTEFAGRPLSAAEKRVPYRRFKDVKINDPDFDRLLAPELPDGSTVADEVRSVRYVVDHAHGLTLAGQVPASPSTSSAIASSSKSVYDLDADQALKRIAPVSPAARNRLLSSSDANQEQAPEAAQYNTIYVFQWDDGGRPMVSYRGNGFLKVSEILPYLCGLGIGEFSGAEELLELRLAGDWIVRQDATVAERIHALERVVREETGLQVTFEQRRVDAPVVRATGIFQYHPLPGTRGENDVQLFAERSLDERGTSTGRGHGTVAQLLRHITNRTGRRFVDDTLSSDIDVSWSDYRSLELDPIRLNRQTYRYDLAQLLEYVGQQTDLKFVTERRTIDEWHVSVAP